MQPKLDGIAIILNVRDVLRTEHFYTEHLGIQFARQTEEDGSVWLLAKIGNEVEMLVFPGDPQPGNTPGIVFGLAEGGIDTIITSLATAGVEIVTPVSEAPGGWSADFKDPDGHVISFFQTEALPRALAAETA
jgi:glyoxylase I family protein